MGLPADNADGYRDGSPITHARKLRGNLLLIHGTGDDNCHYQGTERLMEELIARREAVRACCRTRGRTHAIKEGRNTDQHLMGAVDAIPPRPLAVPACPRPGTRLRDANPPRLDACTSTACCSPPTHGKPRRLSNCSISNWQDLTDVVPKERR